MFFGEEDIATKLLCPRCKTMYADPKIIVPCFETLCGKCIQHLTEANEINCHFCHSQHSVPKYGFVSNKLIAEMVALRETKLSSNMRVEEFKEKINRVLTLTSEFKWKFENAKLIINEYFRDVKGQVDLLVKTKKKEMDEMRGAYLKAINKHEQDCVNNLSKMNTQLLLGGVVDEADKFGTEWKTNLENSTIDDELVSEPSRPVDDYLARLEHLHGQPKSAKFNGQLLKFKANECQTAVTGRAEFEKLMNVSKDSPQCKYFIYLNAIILTRNDHHEA
jgi:primosomal protein N''